MLGGSVVAIIFRLFTFHHRQQKKINSEGFLIHQLYDEKKGLNFNFNRITKLIQKPKFYRYSKNRRWLPTCMYIDRKQSSLFRFARLMNYKPFALNALF